MPRTIDGNTYYTAKELLARYQEGLTDGRSNEPTRGFSEGDLIKARAKGEESSSKLMQEAVNKAFNQGQLEGRSTVNWEAQRTMLSGLQAEITAAVKKAEELGCAEGKAATHADAFLSGKQKAETEAWNLFQRMRPQIANKAVEDFILSGLQPHNHSENKFMRLMRTLPLCTAYKPLINGREINGPLRLCHFRYHPLKVTNCFIGSYIIMPAVLGTFIYSVLSYRSQKRLKKQNEIEEKNQITKLSIEELNRKRELERKKDLSQTAHGETSDQYESRKKVNRACKQLKEITPAMFELDLFSEEQVTEMTSLLEDDLAPNLSPFLVRGSC